MGTVQPPKWSRPRNDPQPWNDPQIDPEMIPTPKWSPLFFLSTPKWSSRNQGMVIKHETGDYFFVLCWNATILSFNFILTKPQIKGNYFLGHCLVPVSLQSRSSRAMTHLKVRCAMFQTTWFLVLLLCFVLRSVKKGRILSTTWRTSTVKKTSWRKFFRSVQEI